MTKGWRNEPYRHDMARKGIRTGKFYNPAINIEKRNYKYNASYYDNIDKLILKYGIRTDGKNLIISGDVFLNHDIKKELKENKQDIINRILVSENLYWVYHKEEKYAKGMFDAFGKLGINLDYPPLIESYLYSNRIYDKSVKKSAENYIWGNRTENYIRPKIDKIDKIV